MTSQVMWRLKMAETELDINKLLSSIDSINQINSVPAVAGLKEVINRWVNEKTQEALADPVIRLQTYSVWRRQSGDEASERVVALAHDLPEHGLGGEVRQFIVARVNQELEEAEKDPANKMLFFRSWLASSGGQVEVGEAPPEAKTESLNALPGQDETQYVW